MDLSSSSSSCSSSTSSSSFLSLPSSTSYSSAFSSPSLLPLVSLSLATTVPFSPSFSSCPSPTSLNALVESDSQPLSPAGDAATTLSTEKNTQKFQLHEPTMLPSVSSCFARCFSPTLSLNSTSHSSNSNQEDDDCASIPSSTSISPAPSASASPCVNSPLTLADRLQAAAPRITATTFSSVILPDIFSQTHAFRTIKRQRRLALSVPHTDEDEPQAAMIRHLSLSLSLPSPRHKHFLLSSFLSLHPFFCSLSREAKKRVFDEMVRTVYHANSVLQQIQQECDKFFVIESGTVVRTKQPSNEQRMQTAVETEILTRGATFGDLSLYHPSISTCTIRTCSAAVVVWSIDGGLVRSLLSHLQQHNYQQKALFFDNFRLFSGEERQGEEEAGAAAAESGLLLTAAEKASLLDKTDLLRFEEGEWIVPSFLSKDHIMLVQQGVVRVKVSDKPISFKRLQQQQQQQQELQKEEQKDANQHMLLSVNSIIAAESFFVQGITTASLPRLPSPIPQTDAQPPRKRKRARSSSVHELDQCSIAGLWNQSDSLLSTIYEHEKCIKQNPVKETTSSSKGLTVPIMTQSAALVSRAVSSAAAVLLGSPSYSSGTECLFQRCVSSPAIMQNSDTAAQTCSDTMQQPVLAPVGSAAVCVSMCVCASPQCAMLAIPLDTLHSPELKRVRAAIEHRFTTSSRKQASCVDKLYLE